MKILSFNIGYLLGFDSFRSIWRRPNRVIRGNRSFIEESSQEISDMIKNYDVALLQEVDLGSFRSHNQNQASLISQNLGYNHRADVKYRGSFCSLPIFNRMGNATFWESGTCHKRYLSDGMKRLFHIYENNDIHILSVHLSKTKRKRKRQLSELGEVTEDLDSFLIMGDFNVKSRSELNHIGSGVVHIPGGTFPRNRPSNEYDMLFASHNLNVEFCRTIDDVDISDHKPIEARLS